MIDNTQIKLLIKLKPGAQLVQYENKIFKDHDLLITYAKSLSSNPIVEKCIKSHHWMCFPKMEFSVDYINYIIYTYAINVLTERWIVAERIIKWVDWRWDAYKNYHNMVYAHSFKKPEVPKKVQWNQYKNLHNKAK